MRKFMLAICVLLLAGCGASYDKDGFAMVRSYLDEQTSAVSAVVELDDGGEEQATEIRQINARYWDDPAWPSDEEMSSWLVNLSQGEQEWTLEGEDLAEATYELEAASDHLARMIVEGGDEQRVERAFESAEAAVVDARGLFQP